MEKPGSSTLSETGAPLSEAWKHPTAEAYSVALVMSAALFRVKSVRSEVKPPIQVLAVQSGGSRAVWK